MAGQALSEWWRLRARRTECERWALRPSRDQPFTATVEVAGRLCDPAELG